MSETERHEAVIAALELVAAIIAAPSTVARENDARLKMLRQILECLKAK